MPFSMVKNSGWGKTKRVAVTLERIGGDSFVSCLVLVPISSHMK